jgi:hypothetical protein
MAAVTKKVRIALSLGLLVASILLGFQNCMEMPEDAALESSKDIPFPYEVKMDTVGYMSCTAMSTPEPNAYFTMRIGALRDGSGISYTQTFINDVSANNHGFGYAQELLTQAPYQDLRLQMSVRPRSDLTAEPIGVQGVPPSQSVFPLWDRALLSVDPLFSQIFTKTPAHPLISYSSARDGHIKLIGQITLNQSSTTDILNRLSTTGMPVISFQKGDEYSYHLLKKTDIGDLHTGIYGSGFYTAFSYPTLYKADGTNGVYQAPGPKAIVQVIQENQANGNRGNGQWSCPGYANYRIVPIEFAAQAGCNPNQGVPVSGSKEKMAYDDATALLNMNGPYWIVDQTNHCAIRNTNLIPHPPGANTCYSDPSLVAWGLDSSGRLNCGGSTGKYCPEFFSICAPDLPIY